MKFLNKMERKFGKFAISNIMRYVLILYGIGTAIGFFMPGFYELFLALDFNTSGFSKSSFASAAFCISPPERSKG